MKRSIVTAALLVVSAAVALVVGFSSREATASSRAALPPELAVGAQPGHVPSTPAANIARGEHLVLTAGCHDCHTPLKMGANGPEPDMSRALSGHPASVPLPPAPAAAPPWIVSVTATNTAWSGPWGVSFTANLTPDKETGLGAWSKQTFIQSIRTGRHMGRGRPILPPMPVPALRNFSDDELGAIFDYLGTIPAVNNHVPDPLAPVPAPAPVSAPASAPAKPKRG